MPRGDGTGPYGTGPIGWGLGPCGRGLGRAARPYGYYGTGRRAGVGYGSWLASEAQRLEALLVDVRSELGQINADRNVKDPE